MRTLLQDVRYGIRMLMKNPGYTLIAVFTLALGIGANTALFSVVNGVILNPLPYPQPEQLVMLYENSPAFEKFSISYPNLKDWQRSNSTFAEIAGYRSDDFTIAGSGETERVRVGMVSADFFPILGVNPMLGRLFSADDDRRTAAPVTLISYGLWQRKFGSAPDIVGKRMNMDGHDYTVIGVIPASFYLQVNNFDTAKDVYIPLGQLNDPLFQDRGVHAGMDAIGRLKPGVSLAAARADMDQIARNLAAAYPNEDKNAGVTILPLKQDMVRDVQLFLWVLLGAVGFVLLIACVNVANLQLARSTGRAREFAIRAALGASQGRVIRQLLTESILIGLAGGGIGACLAAWGTQAAIRVLPNTLPRAEEVRLDAHVLIFTLALSVLAGVVFGLAPALKTSRPNLQDTLKESGRGASGAKHHALGVFVVVEMAMALVLLTGAGLMIRSLAALWSVDPGFNPHNILVFDVTLSRSLGANATTIRSALRELEEKLRGVPGVRAVSCTGGGLPMTGDDEISFWPDGKPKPANQAEMDQTLFYTVGPGYLDVMGIQLDRGRFFTTDDNEHSSPVVVVDEDFAQKYFPGEDPIGKRIHIAILDTAPEIVGVIRHVKHWGLDSEADQQKIQAETYIPLMQVPDKFWSGSPQAQAVLRSSGPPAALAGTVRETITKLNSENVMFETRTMDAIIGESLAARRFSMVLLSVFAGIALLLSSIGIYGVISYVVGQRTHEIGIRLALGAQRRDVLRLMLGEGMKMAIVGVAIGVCAALGLTHLMNKMLFGVSATDPVTFAGVALVLSGVALAACYIPARRAMRVDPIIALRYE
jgi:predicted permease